MDVEQPFLTASEVEALARRIDRPVVLVGMMGVGKSSIGKRLAHSLHMPFVDADDAIEDAAKMTIPEIFETFDEAYFRDGERRVIARLVNGDPQVIATGGGAFCNPETRALILDKAIAVWLDCDVDTLVDRTSRRGNRPLLKQGNPREIITRLKTAREEAYSQAPIHVTSGNVPHSRTVHTILRGIESWL